mmetsp:Transcript_8219/g.23646  ORF Transcript_8219/g.23646 Transcript_8219/m.23646 type:complete len:88 (-) Transcript_8219:54-317(-)
MLTDRSFLWPVMRRRQCHCPAHQDNFALLHICRHSTTNFSRLCINTSQSKCCAVGIIIPARSANMDDRTKQTKNTHNTCKSKHAHKG